MAKELFKLKACEEKITQCECFESHPFSIQI